ncbi:MAG: DEAD/DEAH box helicase [Clostridia bacterium]|nr:DEAD/DEAH box helicase [Clostridia bacterium]
MDEKNMPLTGTALRRACREIGTAWEELERAYQAASEKRTAVCKAEAVCAAAEADVVLCGIDIEEINRNKQGFRTALLRENGIATIGDLITVSESRLVNINGVGQAGAKKLKKEASAIRAELIKQTRVSLSADNLDADRKTLIRALYDYMLHETVYERSVELHRDVKKRLPEALEEVKPAFGGLRRVFSSGEKKRAADAAAAYLSDLYASGFSDETKALCDALKKKTFPSERIAVQDFTQNAAKYFSLLEYLTGKSAGAEAESGGLTEEERQEIENVPLDITGLKCTLRSYQTFGVKFILSQGNVLLGDEMGLGKTVQAIGVMVALRNAGRTHFMVVCPASVLVNWCRETEKHSDLKAYKLHGGDQSVLSDWVENGGVAVTTYESCIKYEIPDTVTVSLLTVDEAHYVKNPEARRTKAVLALAGKAQRVLYMTGTPLENNVDEMCFLLGSLKPSLKPRLQSMKSLSAAPQFRAAVSEVYFRRTRKDVLGELPQLNDIEDWTALTAEDRRIYADAVGEGNFMAMRQVSWQTDDIFASAKAKRLTEICEEAKAEDRKVLVFSFFLNTVDRVCKILGERCIGPITGAVAPAQRQALVDAFTAAEAGSVLVAQIQAGGTGLNIQSASVVVLCEPQIKPSIESQAIGRAYRMGQARSVLVYRLLCEKCVDERVTALLREKQNVFDHFADESVSGTESLQLSEQNISEIIAAEQAQLAQ